MTFITALLKSHEYFNPTSLSHTLVPVITNKDENHCGQRCPLGMAVHCLLPRRQHRVAARHLIKVTDCSALKFQRRTGQTATACCRARPSRLDCEYVGDYSKYQYNLINVCVRKILLSKLLQTKIPKSTPCIRRDDTTTASTLRLASQNSLQPSGRPRAFTIGRKEGRIKNQAAAPHTSIKPSNWQTT